ncbi:hypothetical protein V8F20_012176 [Naviculisporaceae sp. PSN 640]
MSSYPHYQSNMAPISRSLNRPTQGQPQELAADDYYRRRSMVPAPLSFPEVEDLSDCESSDESEYNQDHEVSITQPTKAFFLGVRRSRLLTPRELEEGGLSRSSRSTSASTLAQEPDSSVKLEDEKSKPKPLIPDINPLEYHGLDPSPLPPKKASRLYRYLRWNFGSVYRRVFCLAFLGNMAALIYLLTNYGLGKQRLTYQQAGTAVTVNLLAAMIVRNEHFVNALFWVFGTWSARLPFWARKLVAKIYSYGGIHSGGAVAATFWYIAYLVLLTLNFQSGASISVMRSYIYFVSYAIVLMLFFMLLFAHPSVRVKMHNSFEGVHRFMGWSVVLLFWAQMMLTTADSVLTNTNTTAKDFGHALLVSPNFWMLIVITLLVVYPWSRLRLRDVEAEVLSDHCLKLNFKYRDVHYGQAIRLTDAPLKETHAFGVVPFPAAAPKPQAVTSHCPGCNCQNNNNFDMNSSQETLMSERNHFPSTKSSPNTEPASTLTHAGEKGFSVFISNAGDWTQKMIRNPPKKIYTRGTPQFGVMRCAGLFSPCIIMATGSGIAPCLSLFVQKPEHPVRIIWSAPSPLETYGRAVVDLLYKTDPKAIIIDTRKTGRPDLVKIGYRVWEESQPKENGERKEVPPCEALVIISNQKVTKKVVYGLESRGVPAYGAIFDS